MVINKDGIPYRLVLWGFVPDEDGTCPATLSDGAEETNVFTTKEGQSSFGCLFGTFSQERPLKIAKTAEADANSQGVTIPSFSYATEDALGLLTSDAFGPLTPTNLGQDGTVTSASQNILVGQSNVTVQERAPSPAGSTQQSGWSLTEMSCVNGEGDEVNATYDLPTRTVDLTNVGLAPSVGALNITCTFTNRYEARSRITLVKNLVGAPTGVTASQWTLSATGTDTVTTGAAVSGNSGTTQVTRQPVPSGTYSLSETPPTGVNGFVQTSLTCRTAQGTTVPVTDGQVTLPDGADVTCTYVNTYRTGELVLVKTIDDPARGWNANTIRTFPISYDCGTSNGVTYSGTRYLAVGAFATVTDLPVGASCTVTETTPTTQPGDFTNSSYHWLTPTISTTPVTISDGASATVTVTNRIAQDTGSLVLAKSVKPEDGTPADGYTGTRTFPLTYTCSLDGAVVSFGTVDVANGDSTTVTVPAGATCTTSEELPTTQDGDFSATYYDWTRNQVVNNGVTVTTGATVTTTVENYFQLKTVPLTVFKTVVGPDGTETDTGYLGGDTHTFSVTVDCGDTTTTVEVPNGGSQTIQVPRGTTCQLAESPASLDPAQLDPDFEWNPTGIRYVDADGNDLENNAVAVGDTGASARVINPTTPSWGGIAITKTVAPDTTPLNVDATFTFDVSCDAPAQGQTENYSTTVELAVGQVWRNTDALVPSGTTCTVTEHNVTGTSTGLRDSSYVWSSTSISSVDDSGNPITVDGNTATVTAHAASADATHPYPPVTYTNTWERSYGTIGVDKMLVPLASDPTVGVSTTFTGTWTCDYGNGTEVVSGTWSRTGGGTATLAVTSGAATLNDDATRASVLIGSRCTVTEDDPGYPDPNNHSFTWESRVPGPAVTVTTTDPNPTLGYTNEVGKDYGDIRIRKAVTGGAAGTEFDDADFTFDFSCLSGAGHRVEGTVSLKNLAGQNLTDGDGNRIPAGSTCTITESTTMPGTTDPYRWDGVSFSFEGTNADDLTSVTPGDRSITFTLPDEGTPSITVVATNAISRHTGQVSVAKTVADANKANGFTAGTTPIFPVTLMCTEPGSGTPTVAGTATLADAGIATFDVPLGSTCTAVEGTIVDGLADASYTWGTPTYSADVTVAAEGDNGTITVTNTIKRAYGTIDLTKVITGDGAAAQQGRDVTYSGTFTCTHQGDAPVTGTWTVVGPGSATVLTSGGVDVSRTNTVLPLGASCTATENAPGATATNPGAVPNTGDPAYVWGASGASAKITDAVVSADATHAMVVTNEILRTTTSVSLTKHVTGASEGLADPAQPFTIFMTCTDPGNDAFDPRSIVLTDGQTGDFARTIPRGWTCTLSESSLTQNMLKDVSYAWGTTTYTVMVGDTELPLTDGTTFTVPADAAALTVTIDNPVRRVTGTVEINKALTGAASQEGMVDDGTTFGGSYNCVYAGETIATGTWTVTGMGKAVLTNSDGTTQGPLPLTTSCTATETAPDDARLRNVSWEWTNPTFTYTGDGSSVIATTDTPASITVTNDVTRVYAPLTVVKEYVGDGAALSDGATIGAVWDCTDPDGGRWTSSLTLPAAGGSTTIESPRIPAGSECTLRENTLIPDLLSDSSWAWNTPTYAVSTDGATYTPVTGEWHATTLPDAPLTMKIVNDTHRLYGSLQIAKSVPDGSTADTKNLYAGTWSCTAEDGTVKDGTWTRIGTGRATLTANDGAPVEILVGSTCTTTETSRPVQPVAADVSYQWSANLPDVPVTATRPTVTLGEPADLTVVNETLRNLGSFSIAKAAIAGASDGAASDGTYQVGYSCTSGTDAPRTGTVTLTAAGAQATVEDIPLGATCTVTEVVPGTGSAPSNLVDANSFVWRTPMTYTISGATAGENSDPGSATMTLPADPQADPTLVTVTNTVDPVAQVDKTFVGTTKHLDADGAWTGETWDVTYTVTVTNPSSVQYLTYDLVDTPTVPTGTTLNSIAVTGGALTDPVSAAAGPVSVVTGASLPANTPAGTGVHTYTVVLNVTAPDTGVPGVTPDGTCSEQAAIDGTAIHNTATATSNGQDSTDEDCGNVPINPKFAASKSAVDVVRDAETGGYTATYTVTVSNTSNAASQVIADVTDTPTLPTGVSLTGVTVSEGGQPAPDAVIPTITDGALTGPITLAPAGTGPVMAGTDQAPGGEDERVLTVALAFTVDATTTGFDDTDYQCGHDRADGAPSGLHNLVTMDGDTDGTENNEACLDLQPRLTVSKAVTTTGVGTSSSFEVSYTITVVNDGDLAQSTGTLTDTPAFAPGLGITGARVIGAGGTVTDPAVVDDQGRYVLTEGDVVEPGQTLTYTITFAVTVDPGDAAWDETLLDCSVEDGSTIHVPGHGLFNEVLPTEGRDATGRTDNTACEPVTPDAGRRSLTIIKNGTDGNLDGATFEIYTMDPSSGGATPIPDGVLAQTGQPGVFTTAGLDINRDYWLVETQAPAGHQLMPTPVRFHLTADAIILADGQNLGVNTVAISGDGTLQTTVTVTDTEIGKLPLSGGAGIIPVVLIFLGLLAAAGVLLTTSTRRHRHGA